MTSLVAVALLAACRPDPGAPPDYAAVGGSAGNSTFALGPDPYEEGTERFSFGLFYEGGFSESAPIDDITRFWWIWDEVQGLTFEQTTSNDMVEGLQSDLITVLGLGFWGAGVEWTVDYDLTGWTAVHISMKSFDPEMVSTEIALGDATNASGAPDYAFVAAEDYGFEPDGRWHHLTIPIADYEALGVDLTSPSLPFALSGASVPSGAQIWIDNLYLSKEEL